MRESIVAGTSVRATKNSRFRQRIRMCSRRCGERQTRVLSPLVLLFLTSQLRWPEKTSENVTNEVQLDQAEGPKSPILVCRQQFDGRFQRRVLLANDLIESGCAHSGLLQLLERAARFDSLMLARIADQKHAVTIIGTKPRKELAHLVGKQRFESLGNEPYIALDKLAENQHVCHSPSNYL